MSEVKRKCDVVERRDGKLEIDASQIDISSN